MSKRAREDREATGWTSIRVTRATRDELVMLLHMAQLRTGSREHERGGRQYGTRAELTLDDVVYYVASSMLDLELGENFPGERCLQCKQPHLRPAVRELVRIAKERQQAAARAFLEGRGVIEPARSAPTSTSSHPHASGRR